MKLIDLIPKVRPFVSLQDTLYEQDHQDEFDLNRSIYEGIYKSYPKQDLIRAINSLNLSVHPHSYQQPGIIYVQFKKHDDFNSLSRVITQHGWYISQFETDTDKEFKQGDTENFLNEPFRISLITAETLHDQEVATPKILFHATPLDAWNKIQTTGLSPKSKSVLSTHPDRVYFTTTLNRAIDLARQIAKHKIDAAQKTDKFDPEQYYKSWAILQIDTTKIPHTRNVSYFRVHEDPNTDREATGELVGVYSQNYVPPTAISLVKIVNVH